MAPCKLAAGNGTVGGSRENSHFDLAVESREVFVLVHPPEQYLLHLADL